MPDHRSQARSRTGSMTKLHVIWIPLIGNETGSAPIDSYNIQWDNSTNAITWYNLQGDGIDYPYNTQIFGVFEEFVYPGRTYKMRLRAHNVHGWSDWSPILIIKSTGLPMQPLPPTTKISS